MNEQICNGMPPHEDSAAKFRLKYWTAPKLTVESIESETKGTFAGTIFDGSFTS